MMLDSWFLVLAVLTACSMYDSRDESSYYYAVPVGSSLVLHQHVSIQGEQVATYVQNGELMPYDSVNKHLPNCKFELYTMSEQPRTVDPDTFEIIRVVDEIESSSLPKDIQVALRGDALMLGMLDKSYVFNYATMMYLKSENQKDVYRMTCQHWEDIRDDRHLTIEQMRQAMGEVFTLKIKQ
jgi:hypothetical protein